MEDRVTIEISGGVADVRLVRIDKMNAVDDAMKTALIAAGDRLSLRCRLAGFLWNRLLIDAD